MPRKVPNVIEKGDGKVRSGLPSMGLLPMGNYSLKMYKKEYTISIPLMGNYKDLYEKNKNEDFCIIDSNDDGSVDLNLPMISKVLVASRQYPDLEPNQLFVPLKMVLKDEFLELTGNIVEFFNPKKG